MSTYRGVNYVIVQLHRLIDLLHYYRHQHQTRWRPRVTLHDIASSHATDNCSLAGLGLDTGVFPLAWSRY